MTRELLKLILYSGATLTTYLLPGSGRGGGWQQESQSDDVFTHLPPPLSDLP